MKTAVPGLIITGGLIHSSWTRFTSRASTALVKTSHVNHQLSIEQKNGIFIPVIPLAVLTEPYFQQDMPRYIPYGTMGLIFTHEILHAFDKLGMHIHTQLFGASLNSYACLRAHWAILSISSFMCLQDFWLFIEHFIFYFWQLWNWFLLFCF